ncbi:MAG: UbiD family decarboxylase [Proteobacteria bacterium]|nr:UbiD family decarboxylase [Pseudomonadota bacterium]
MKGITDIRSLLERVEKDHDLIRVQREVDPVLELAAVVRATDMGPVMLFDKVKNYPGRRVISNIFSDRSRIAAWCGVAAEYLPRFLADAAARPVAPVEITDAPSQQEVVTRNINVLETVPITKQTAQDAGYVITGGIVFARDPETGDFNSSYHRMRVLGPDSTCITIQAGRHLLEIVRKFRKQGQNKVPVTVNIGAGPATLLACSGSTQQTLTPLGYDELGFAGAIQGEAVRYVASRTQPGAWGFADAELVLEGYIDTDRLVSEEDSGQDGVKAMMPEAGGYMGRAWRVWEFKITAITHRRDFIYWAPLAINAETTSLMAMPAEASIFDACRRISPKVFDTCYVLPGMRGCLGVVLRINRKGFRDEGVQTNLLFGALSAHSDMGWVIAVDHDIDLMNSDEVLWALITRTDLSNDIMITPKAKVSGMLAEGDAAGTGRKIAFDATASFKLRDRYERGSFATVNLTDWLSSAEVDRVRSQQSDYLKSMLRRGY